MESSVKYIVTTLEKFGIDIQSDLPDIIQKSKEQDQTEKILSVYKNHDGYKLTLSSLGLKYSKKTPRVFNSRIETIKKKQNWLDLFSNNRMLVPMSGFYEWKKEGTQKIPYRIFIPGEELFFVAALYHIESENNFSSSLITTLPNDFVKPIHNRMPVIFTIRDGIKYLNNEMGPALDMCLPFNGEMKMEKVQ